MKVPFNLVSLKSLQRLSLVALFLVMSVAVIRPIDASAQDNTYTIYFDNTVGWEKVYTWVWDKNEGNKNYYSIVWKVGACHRHVIPAYPTIRQPIKCRGASFLGSGPTHCMPQLLLSTNTILSCKL